MERTPMRVEPSERVQGRDPDESRTACSGTMTEPPRSTTVGWSPACSCGHDETAPAVVLDPFCGSGTTVRVANRLRRRAVGLDLSAEYFKLALDRTTNVQTEFA